jgi:NADH-quinone oxidoreductase E subunit
MEETLEKILQNYTPGRKEGLIPVLQEIQELQGYLTEEAVEKVGKHLNLPLNKVYGVAAFYDQFRFKPRGRHHIRICKGTACYLFGSSTFLKEIEGQLKVRAGHTSRDKKFSLEVVSCLGACGQAPVIQVNETHYTRVDAEQLNTIIRMLKEKN